jgi:hypothetical protein
MQQPPPQPAAHLVVGAERRVRPDERAHVCAPARLVPPPHQLLDQEAHLRAVGWDRGAARLGCDL